MYTTGHPSSDYPAPPIDFDMSQQFPNNNFDSGPYRASADLNNLNNFFNTRPRQNTAPSTTSLYTTDGNSFGNNMGVSAADLFGTHQAAQQQVGDSYHSLRSFDYGGAAQQNVNLSTSVFNNVDPFGTAALLPSQVGKIQVQSQALVKSQQQQAFANSTAAAFLNGIMQAHSQTPYGPHVTNGVSAGAGGTHASGNTTGNTASAANEEISTIFVVGFPDDMQEREFQNMFTFSTGFEAATLKIPNKDSTAYGAGAAGPMSAGGLRPGFGFNYPSSYSNDPYNMLTLNQGGVVVDGRDGTASWPAAMPGVEELAFGRGDNMGISGHPGSQGAGNGPPRKQIIGFAKFRSRSEALAARDVLQGRRVDFDKGAVLKAEMAKKNLHTKRGVGPPGTAPSGMMNGNGITGGGNSSAAGVSNPDNLVLGGMTALNMNALLSPTTETLSARDRELGALSAMGLGGMATQRRERLEAVAHEEERENRRRRDFGSLGVLSGMLNTTRGPRERAEEEERERDRRRSERDSSARMRSSSLAFEAFQHRIGTIQPPSMFRNPSAATLSSDSSQLTVTGGGNSLASGNQSRSSPMENPNVYPYSTIETPNQGPGSSFQDGTSSGNVDVWPPGSNVGPRRLGSVNSLRVIPSAAPPRSPSSRPASPLENRYDISAFPQSISQTSSISGQSDSSAISAGFDSSLDAAGLGNSQGYVSGSRAFSPTAEPHQGHSISLAQSLTMSTVSTSSASSVSSSRNSAGSIEGEFVQALGSMNIGADQGLTSPQLPSPGSGSSSGHRGNSSDQNPPINTLYVGNLPTSPIPSGYPPNYLEESLRGLFQRCPGYRKLCFRQKSNGPMCFVEFDDVAYATKALNELYGNPLNGLIKGGIRLSYSKNPLGVRTPTSNGGGSAQQQQAFNGYASMQEAFSPRQTNNNMLPMETGSFRGPRRDLADMGSPTASTFQQATSPPRFFSPPPAFPYGLQSQQPSAPFFGRALSQGFGQPEESSVTFSPFGLPPSPHQMTNEAGDYIHSNMSSTPSIEATRAG